MKQSTKQTSGKPENTAEATLYSKDELITHSQALFASQPEVLIGALHGCEENEFTIEAANQRIQNFLQRKVLA
ncbi:hypothetical protein HQN90_11780 [Paenibacillus alba]|uniref:hypothetical protein n=1 Tax=Paenibacillus alba TaxID=1197127 RepID=UPI00156517A2|nr:hypothetical protein [Paenibacillus alba]NQX66803.1 hypothetical protein [Paenibacillus alba]